MIFSEILRRGRRTPLLAAGQIRSNLLLKRLSYLRYLSSCRHPYRWPRFVPWQCRNFGAIKCGSSFVGVQDQGRRAAPCDELSHVLSPGCGGPCGNISCRQIWRGFHGGHPLSVCIRKWFDRSPTQYSKPGSEVVRKLFKPCVLHGNFFILRCFKPLFEFESLFEAAFEPLSN